MAKAILESTQRNFGITGTLLLYRLVQYLCFPIVVVYFLARLARQVHYWPHFTQRLGFLPRSFTRTASGSVWFHAVSVGEVASAVPLIRALRERLPGTPVYLSTGTVAGRRAAYRHVLPLVDGIFYAPIDYSSCVRRTIRALRPALLVVLETEIWPNLYAEMRGAGGRLALVNARISDRALPSYRRFKRFLPAVLGMPDLVLAQSAMDADRYTELGVPPSRLAVSGNLKYDAALYPPRPFAIPKWGAEQIWIAASTVGPHERGSAHRHNTDEDDVVIEAFRQLAPEFPKLLLIIAPRQPARFDAVASKLRSARIPFVRRSRFADLPFAGDSLPEAARLTLPGVLLLDTIGELAAAYAHANVVFVGGSIAPRGGHNFLEPAAAGAPVIVGPHMGNFSALLRDFLAESALLQIGAAEELAPAVRALLADPERAAVLGLRGRSALEAHRGVAARAAEQLASLQHRAFPRRPRNFVARAVLSLLSSAWIAGGRRKRTSGLREICSQAPLGRPVISIGGITMGGSGKTPFCEYLAAEFSRRGMSPAILTRGYHRRSPAKIVVLPAGAHVPSALTGDEAQIFLNSGKASVAISAHRYSAAQALLAEDPEASPLLLDDGFQHARMRRDFDIVLIDGLDPFGGDAVFPNGRLREPLSALQRADAFVITRPGYPERADAISARLSRYNPSAPVFRARQVARLWREFVSGRANPIDPGTHVAAFCGLGNPQSFWNTLRDLRMDVVFHWTFGDHHQYRPIEIPRLVHQARAHGADYLVTTEKDAVNLPPDTERLLAGMPLLWLKVELALTDPAAFFSYLAKRVGGVTHLLS